MQENKQKKKKRPLTEEEKAERMRRARQEKRRREREASAESEERPKRRAEGEKPKRRPEGEKPKRRPEGEKPKRKPEGEKPRRKPSGEKTSAETVKARKTRPENKKPPVKQKKSKKKPGIASTLVLIVALLVFLYSAFQLYQIFSGYKKGDNEYENLRKKVITENKDATNEAEQFTVDFEELKKINPDVIGWIRFEEPSIISYPVVHSKDNKEYLKKLFGEGKNTYGTIFVDKDNRGDFSDRNTFVYGHYMKSGSMFGQLNKYQDQEFYKNHPYFYMYTVDGRMLTYEVYSAGVVKDTSESYTKTYASEEEFQHYIDVTKEASAYPTEAEVTTDSQILSLSTCTRASNEDRFLLHAVKIREEQVGDNGALQEE